MKSIEKQLNLSLAVSILLIFLIFWWLSVFTIHHLTEDYILTRLEHDTLSIENTSTAAVKATRCRQSITTHQPDLRTTRLRTLLCHPARRPFTQIALFDRLPPVPQKSPYAISHYETKGPRKALFWFGGSSATTKVNR